MAFLRNFDEFNLERLSPAEQREVFDRFAPDPQMRVYGRGIRRRLAPMLDGDAKKVKMALSLVLSMPGTPLFMFGDEIGMGEDLTLPERDSIRTPMQWSDERHGGFSKADQVYRHPVSSGAFGFYQVNVEAQRHDPTSTLNTVKRFIALRKEHPAFGCGHFRVLDTGVPAVLGLAFSWKDDAVVTLHNLSGDPIEAELDAEVLERMTQMTADQQYPEP
ncbi:MAG: trehalose synthase, partial [Methanobacteriota archaeon]